jgi:hypothetical protein
VTVYLPDETRRISTVDGGNGHSGKRSPDVLIGLGDIPKYQKVKVEVAYRDATGNPQSQTLELSGGWHTVVLKSEWEG